MGHWGVGPYDNDTAADFMFDLPKKPITELIERGLNSTSYEEIRAAAWLLQQVGYNYTYPLGMLEEHLQLAVDKLSAMAADTEWIESWRDPKAIHASILKQIFELGQGSR